MLKITKENYDYYKSIFGLIWTFQASISGMAPNAAISPINVLKEWEQKSMSIARRGLKAGLLDTFQMLLDLPTELKEKLNEKLAAASFPNLNKLISVVKDTPSRVLKRGKIKNLEEYYIIKEVVDDMAYDVSAEDREILNDLFFLFESTYAKRRNNT